MKQTPSAKVVTLDGTTGPAYDWLQGGDGSEQMGELLRACEDCKSISRDNGAEHVHSGLFAGLRRDHRTAKIDYEGLLGHLLKAHPESINATIHVTEIEGRGIGPEKVSTSELTPLEYVCKNFPEVEDGETHCPFIGALLRHGARVTPRAFELLAAQDKWGGGGDQDLLFVDLIWQLVTDSVTNFVELPIRLGGLPVFDFFALMSRIPPPRSGIDFDESGLPESAFDGGIDTFLANLVCQTITRGTIGPGKDGPLALLYAHARPARPDSPLPPFLQWLKSGGQSVEGDAVATYLGYQVDEQLAPTYDAAERAALRDSFHSTVRDLFSSTKKREAATCLKFCKYEYLEYLRDEKKSSPLPVPISDGTLEGESDGAAAVTPATLAIRVAADTSPIHQQASVERRLVAMGFDSQQVTQALADSDVCGDAEKAVAFLLAQSKDGHAQGSSTYLAPSTQEQAELLQWRSGTRRFVAEVIDLEAGVIETGAIVTAPPPPVSSKRPLEVAEASTSSGLSQVVQVKREKVEMQTKLSEKQKECERLEDDFDILNDGVEPMTTTINALQTKIDALYCIAYATVPEEHRGSLHALSGLGIDVKKRDGAAQIVDYTCGLLSGMSPSHASKAAAALGIQRTGDLGHRDLLQKIKEALGGTGPRNK